MQEKLKEINQRLLLTSADDKKETKKQLLIKKILNKDNCFYEMSIEEAFAILRDLGIQEADLGKVYSKIIEPSNITN